LFKQEAQGRAWGRRFFGAIAYDATENITLNLEGRFQRDNVSSQVIAGPMTATFPGPEFEEDFDSFQPRLIVEYSLSDESNLYLSAAEATRPGDRRRNAPDV
jgi:outer membrane receptor protein involved in Fe transport